MAKNGDRKTPNAADAPTTRTGADDATAVVDLNALHPSGNSAKPGPAPEEPVSAGPLGLDVVMRWSGEMHRAHFFPRPVPVTIGEGGFFALPDDAMGGKKIDVLVLPDAQHQFALSLANQAMSGQVIVGSQVHAIADIRAGKTPLAKDRVPLTPSTSAFLEFGDFTFVLSRGAVPPPAKPSLWDKEDTLLLLAFVAAGLLILGPLVASFQLAGPRHRAGENPMEDLFPNRTIEVDVVEDKKEPEKEEKAEDKAEEKQEVKNEQPVAPVQPQEKEIAKKVDEIDKALKEATPEEREAKKQEIVAAEVNKATSAVDAALANVPTTKLAADLGTGAEAAAAAGAGNAVVLNTGAGADNPGGPRKIGVGGDNDSGQQVAAGLGKQATDGAGPKLNAEVKAKDQKVLRLGGGAASADGELPPDVIKKVLADKSGALKACYQKELQSNPDLQGSIKVKFMIGPNGAVVGAKIESSSIDNGKVEECITTIIKTMRFPQAKNGGNTTVNKTFTFKSS